MNYTPRQAAGFIELSSRRKQNEAAGKLSLGALAAQGDAKTINKRIKELGR